VAPEYGPPRSRLLAERGDVSVVHAHADWSAPEVTCWLPVLRRHGIQLRHQFRARATQDPALIALTMDAMELTAGAHLDGMVLVGDVGSAMPLLHRLREGGLAVIVAGPPATPLDIRGACTEFVDLRALETAAPRGQPGRHRA
jgi:hypothetical protein